MKILVSLLSVFLFMPLVAQADHECVVLLHGLARTANSMDELEEVLSTSGYRVVNVGCPSREETIDRLAAMAVEEGIAGCDRQPVETIHFVTHSLGGILVRYYLADKSIARLGRVVMLAPPNQGSEVADEWRDVPGYEWLNGPAGQQLGTGEGSVPRSLGPVDFPLGVIAGTRSINPILSQSLPNPDDGKVSVENTRVEGMTDFIEMPYTHTFMMAAEPVIRQVQHFLRSGTFFHNFASSHKPASP